MSPLGGWVAGVGESLQPLSIRHTAFQSVTMQALSMYLKLHIPALKGSHCPILLEGKIMLSIQLGPLHLASSWHYHSARPL